MKIYHTADIHLGRRRLDGRLPDQDLVNAFRYIAQEAVRERAGAFLIAGDLFDRPQVEPTHLRQAQEVLALLKAAQVPVIAIEGNHDKAGVHADAATWVNFLAEDDLLILLRPEFDSNGARLEPWDPVKRKGAWIELGGIRFVGAGYLGAATPYKLRQMLAQLDCSSRCLLLLHAGPDYFVGDGGGFSKEDLALLREKVSYLALGHIHKPMRYEDWACNPGSPENCDLREACHSQDKAGQPIPRGYAVIDLEPGSPRAAALEVRSNPRRPCLRLELDCELAAKRKKTNQPSLVDLAVQLILQGRPDPSFVIELVLRGNLDLGRLVFDHAEIGMEIARQAGVFAVAFDLGHLNVPSGPGASAATPLLPRDELERQTILELVQGEQLWGLDADRPVCAELFYDLKEMVRIGESAEVMANRISSSSLIEKIRLASEPRPLDSALEPPAAPADAAKP